MATFIIFINAVGVLKLSKNLKLNITSVIKYKELNACTFMFNSFHKITNTSLVIFCKLIKGSKKINIVGLRNS